MKQSRQLIGVALLSLAAGFVHADELGLSALAFSGPGLSPYWGKDGHQGTTLPIARISGIDEPTAVRLAYFSQAPDDIWYAYSAPFIGVVSLPWWSYRHRIVAVLHSLHGGDDAAVRTRRERLAAMVKAADLTRTQDHWKTGFLIHALGDSYAHVHPADDNPQAVAAYKELVGHVFDSCKTCTQPDVIARHPDIYAEYVQALTQALARGDAPATNSPALPPYLAKLKTSTDEPNELPMSDAQRQQARNEITFDNVNAFLKQLTEALEKD